MIMSENSISVLGGFNGDALRLAREFRGYRKNELAEMLNLTPSAITQFERKTIRPSSQHVAQLAWALRFPRSFFAQVDVSAFFSADHCHFRSLRSATQIARRKMVGAGNLVARIVDFVEEYGVELPAEQVSIHALSHANTLEEIEDAALSLRSNWGLGLGPIDNVMALLEKNGIVVCRLLEDCKTLDAFSSWHRNRPYIFLNTEKNSTSRTRFDALHEVGHLIIHNECLPGDKQQEDQANYFASSFLMPREPFLKECPKRLVWQHFYEMKSRWKVSLAALVRRARDLKILSEETYKRANMIIGKNGWRTSEPYEPPQESPVILADSIKLLLEHGSTFSDIADKLHLTQIDLHRLVSLGEPALD